MARKARREERTHISKSEAGSVRLCEYRKERGGKDCEDTSKLEKTFKNNLWGY